MSDDKMENLLSDAYSERDQWKQEAESWRNQWKGYQDAKEKYWSLDIPKPNIKVGSFFSTIGKVMSYDIEKLYKAYIVVCITCVVLTAISDIYRNLKEL